MRWLFRDKTAQVAPVETASFYLDANDTLLERAGKLADIAFMDFNHPNRLGMRDQAAFRLAKALELYASLDAPETDAPTEST